MVLGEECFRGGAYCSVLRGGCRPEKAQGVAKHEGKKVDRSNSRDSLEPGERPFGTYGISPLSCRQHLIFGGTSGSGKTLMQRRFMADWLCEIRPGSDKRVFAFDAKNELVPYLKKIGTKCEVISLNPLESRTEMPTAMRWDIARDVASDARAQNAAWKFIPKNDNEGSSKYFTDAARLLLRGGIESYTRHDGLNWSISDLVFTCCSLERLVALLQRDEIGVEEYMKGLLGEPRTAYQVYTSLLSLMSPFKPVAGLWSRTDRALSLCDWVKSDSILLFGGNPTIRAAVDPIYDLMWSTMVEEVLEQPDSETRETGVWVDELRLAPWLLKSGMLQWWTAQARSKGGIFIGGFQDIEGLREAVGEKLANEIVGLCSHKFLGRFESMESARWASDLAGQFETITALESRSGELGSKHHTINEVRELRDGMLPSDFYKIPEPSPDFGVRGLFVSPGQDPKLRTVSPREFDRLITSDHEKEEHGIVRRKPEEQHLPPWSIDRVRELGLNLEQARAWIRGEHEDHPAPKNVPKKSQNANKDAIIEAAQRAAHEFTDTLNVPFGV